MTDTVPLHPAGNGRGGRPGAASTGGGGTARSRGRAGAARAGAQANGHGAVDSALRESVDGLLTATVAELERRRQSAGLEPADSVPVPVDELSSLTRELPRLATLAPFGLVAAADAVRRGVPVEAARTLLRMIELRHRAEERQLHDDVIDEFGFDREWAEALLPLVRWLYHTYWRVTADGLENVPDTGRALLVGNHAGVLPYDGAMVRYAVFEKNGRHARALILNAFFGVPVLSWVLRRTGNTLAHPGDAERLLERDELVLVFPEGAKGTGKPYAERYRLRRFGRGGFASVALRTGAPIVPVSVVGSEEVHPMLANVAPLAGLVGMPYAPITPTFPWLGPLGLIPLPSTWRIRFHPPVPTAAHGAGAAGDPALVMALSDRVRDTIQQGVYDLLEARGSVFA